MADNGIGIAAFGDGEGCCADCGWEVKAGLMLVSWLDVCMKER